MLSENNCFWLILSDPAIIQKCMASISELIMGKILTVHHHRIEKKFHYNGFEINSERDIKSVYSRLIISSLMRKSREILERLQWNIN